MLLNLAPLAVAVLVGLVLPSVASAPPAGLLGQCLGDLKLCETQILSRISSAQPGTTRDPTGHNGGPGPRDVARLLAPRGPLGEGSKTDGGGKQPKKMLGDAQKWGSAKKVSVAGLLTQLNKAKAENTRLRAKLNAAAKMSKVAAAQSGNQTKSALAEAKAENTRLRAKLNAAAKKSTRVAAAATKGKVPRRQVHRMICVGKCQHHDKPCECVGDFTPDGEPYGLQHAPKARLCRAKEDFGYSFTRSAFCLPWNTQVEKDPALATKMPELASMCPKDDVFKPQNGWFSLPTVWLNQSHNDPKYGVNMGVRCKPLGPVTKKLERHQMNSATSYKFETFDCGYGAKGENMGTRMQQASQTQICIGKCMKPPLRSDAGGNVVIRDAPGGSCHCSDGVQLSSNHRYQVRTDQWDTLSSLMNGISFMQRWACQATPPPGCQYCDLGFDPQNEKTWLIPRYNLKTYKIVSQDEAAKSGGHSKGLLQGRHVTYGLQYKTLIRVKKGLFSKCPSWYDPKNFFQESIRDGHRTEKSVTACDKLDKCSGLAPDKSCELETTPKEEDWLEGEDFLELGNAVSNVAGFGRRRRRKKKSLLGFGGFFNVKKRIAAKLNKKIAAFLGGLFRKVLTKLPCIVMTNKIILWKKFQPIIIDFANGKIFNNVGGGAAKNLKKFIHRLKKVFGVGTMERIVPNIIACVGSNINFAASQLAVNKFYEPIVAYQAICERLDSLNPSAGLPRQYSAEEKKSPIWNKQTYKHPELTIVSTTEAEAPARFNCQGDPLCRDVPPGQLQLLPTKGGGEGLPSKHPCTEGKPCTAREYMTWKKKTWMKDPKRDQVFRDASPSLVLFFIRATKPWLQQNGVRLGNLYDMDWRVKKHSQMSRRFHWLECIHPYCVSALRHNLAAVLHSNQTVGKSLGDARQAMYKRDPLYKLIDCKRETTWNMEKRVQQCSKMKALRFKMTEKQKLESKGYWQIGSGRGNTPVAPELELALMEAPTCAAKVEMSIFKCNTCCCKAGMVTTSVKFSMVVGAQFLCGSWLALGDWVTRTFMGVLRLIALTDVLGPRCLQGAASDNPNTYRGKDRKRYCKAKPGGTGKHLHNCGGRKQAASTESTEVQDLGDAQHQEAGRRGKASTIRRGGGRLRATGSFNFGASRFQGNFEEEELGD